MSNSNNLLFSPPYKSSAWSKLHNKSLLVGFSGGKDSLALLKYLEINKDKGLWKIFACHVNHNLRDNESTRDMEFCKNWCLKNNISFICKNADVKNLKEYKDGGLEHAARTARYSLLKEAMNEVQAHYILTAHTLDDQIESFMVDLITGASSFTLGGVREEIGCIVRPMLNVSTEMVNDFLKFYNLTPVYDSSNSDLGFVRNKVRAEIIPIILEYSNSFKNSVLRIQEESKELATWLDEITSVAVFLEKDCLVIDRKIFNEFSIPQKKFLIGKWVSKLFRGGKVHVNAILELSYSNKSVRINMPDQYSCEITPYKIRLFKIINVQYKEKQKSIFQDCMDFGDRKVLFSDKFLNVELTVRNRKNGDRYNEVLLKKIFSDRKIDLYYRDRAVILESNGKILWVEGISPTIKGVKIIG